MLTNQHVGGGAVIPPLRRGEIALVECADQCADQPDCGLAVTLAGVGQQAAGQSVRVRSLAEHAT